MTVFLASQTVFKIIRRASPKRLSFVVGCQIAGAVGIAAQLLALRSLVGYLKIESQGTGLNAQAVLVATAFCLATLVTTGAAAMAQELRLLITEDLRRGMTMRLLSIASRAEYHQFDQPKFHNDLRAAQDTIEQRLDTFPWAVMRIGSAVLDSVAVAIIILRIEPLILLLAAVVGLPLIAATSYKSKVLFGFYYGETATDRRRTYLASMMLDRNRLPELFVHQTRPRLLRRIEEMFELRTTNARLVFNKRIPAVALSNLASVAGLFVAVGATIWLAAIGRISIQEAAVAAVAVNHLRGKSSSLSLGLEEVQQSVPFIELIDQLEDQVSPSQAIDHQFHLSASAKVSALRQVELSNVSFRYPGAKQAALSEISFTMQAGEVIALVGANGSGKSTITKLLAGLYTPTKGRISWNGVELQRALAERPRAVAQLFQDFNRYELSAEENITLGRAVLGESAKQQTQPDVDRLLREAEVRAAAASAGADYWLTALSEGYNTILSRSLDDGTELSGGEWQRLALARTIYRNAELLILDEPTSAQDPKAEADFMERIRSAAAGKTVLLVSHRFSAVQWADAIGVMHGGRLVEWGTHDELMARQGRYHAMFTAQARPYVLAKSEKSPAGNSFATNPSTLADWGSHSAQL